MNQRVAPWVGVVAAIATIASVQPNLAAHFQSNSREVQVYSLPDPEKLKIFSLGYREALADWLFGSTLVEAGFHFSGKQEFPALHLYLEGVVALDPYYRDVYYYADALLTMSTTRSPPENYRHARNLAEAGLKLFPYDQELWRSVGEYLTYVAPPYLPKNEDPDEWRAAGARMVEHSCSLSMEKEVPIYCLTVAKVLNKAGEREASISALERVIRLSRDPEVVAEARGRLEQLVGIKLAAEYETKRAQRDRDYRAEYPFISRELYDVLGVKRDVYRCAGPRALDRAECRPAP